MARLPRHLISDTVERQSLPLPMTQGQRKRASREGESVVVTHPDWGVFLGSEDGKTVWSKLNSDGLNVARTFPNAAIAIEYMGLHHLTAADGVSVRSVTPDRGNFASMQACVHAGLDGWLDRYTEVANRQAC